MSAEENKALVRRYFETGYQEAHEGTLDAVHQYFADHFHDHTSPHPEHTGVHGVKEIISDSSQATRDLRVAIVHIAAEEDIVFVHWRATGTHVGQHQLYKHVRDIEPTVKRRRYLGSPCTGSRGASSSKSGIITPSSSTRSSTAWLGHQAAAPNLRGRLLDRGLGHRHRQYVPYCLRAQTLGTILTRASCTAFRRSASCSGSWYGMARMR